LALRNGSVLCGGGPRIGKTSATFFPYPFLLLFFAAVIASGWCGGAGPGLFAVLLSIFTVDYFFIPPLDSLVINAAAMTYCAAFIVSALFASWVSAVMKKSKGGAQRSPWPARTSRC
jgi:K+-sensing histidine kinase KdpD